jgi:membrane protein implicated in regulation of membrane protease activity
VAVLPSSLIFAVILAVWAAYLMQHWVRRRDHIATARSVDRFSEAMRVLERRQYRPHLDLSEPVAPSYALSPARPASPDVMVKRAVPGPARQIGQQPGVGGAPAASAAEPSSPSGSTGRFARSVGSARTRGLALLAAAAVMVAGTALGMVGILPWWTAAIGISVFVFALLLVRRTVRRSVSRVGESPGVSASAEATRRPARATTPAQPTREKSARTRRSAAVAGGGAAAALAATAASTPEQSQAEPSGAVTARQRGSEVYDIDRVVQVAADVPKVAVNDTPQPTEPPADAAPGTWQPVPVPPPTYTLKAKAVSFAMPEQLPADGTALSLDEEFEDLPVAIRDLA